MDTLPYIVTGANAGIGKAIAVKLAGMGRRVVMVSRDAEKGRVAADEVRAAAKGMRGGSVELVVGSLNTVADARRLGETIRDRYPTIGCLINNAGVWMTKKVLTADGIETTFMVNHLGPFILTNLLLPHLEAGAPARVVNVNAGLYVFGRLDLRTDALRGRLRPVPDLLQLEAGKSPVYRGAGAAARPEGGDGQRPAPRRDQYEAGTGRYRRGSWTRPSRSGSGS